MATIRPFTGLRFSSSAGPIEDLVAPPYDVLSQEERDAYAAKNEHNIVHLTLPEQKADDRSKFVKYARSSALLAEWRRSGDLQLEGRPVFYRYRQRFLLNDPTVAAHGSQLERTAIIALIKTEPYEKGVVLPHEQTFPKHKEDRLRILEATRAHLECIFGLFEDEGGDVFAQIESAPAQPAIQVSTEDGVEHVLELIEDPETISRLEGMLADKKVWIADGHHRYETACTFRAQIGERDHLIAEDFMMMALSSMSDPGLVLLPTHRIVSTLPQGQDTLPEALAADFIVRSAPNSELVAALEPGTFGIALPGGTGLVATLKDPSKVSTLIQGEASEDLKTLDVTILHNLIFETLLGIRGLDTISYTRDPQEAVEAVERGAAASFLMAPPTVDDMRRIALGGEKMPQKSTYYYPKILSGLVMWSLNDFEGGAK